MLGNLFSTYAGQRDAEAFQISRKSGEVQSETFDRIRPVPITWDAVAPQSCTQELAICDILAFCSYAFVFSHPNLRFSK